MARITILDPVAAPPEVDPDPGPDAGSLRGVVVGIRTDTTWRSFAWTIEEWEPRLRSLGADVRVWVSGHRVGEGGEQTAAELAQFVAEVDVGIVGLGN